MSARTLILIVINLLILLAGSWMLGQKPIKSENLPVPQTPIEGSSSKLENKPELPPIIQKISNPQPDYLNYMQTVDQLKKWNEEAPELTEVASYGKSSTGKDIYYLRIVNKRSWQTTDKPRVLITACIHGNEPLSSSTVMWYIGALLGNYGKDPAITELIDSRDIYFVPVVSPDSYPNSRHVNGVDPNRDFPSPRDPTHRSVPPVDAIQKLFLKIRPQAVISGHTWGRVYLIPYGDRMENCPDHAAYVRVIGKMAEMSGYRYIRACDMYKANGGLNNPPIRSFGEGTGASIPIHGTEVDWYYRNGAMAIVCEFGTHQRIPTKQDTQIEFDKTFNACLHFIREAPLVQLHPR